MSGSASIALGLEGRRALVTGASSELGALVAEALHGAGAHVGLVARRVDRLDSLAARLKRAVAVAGDLSDVGSLPGVHQQVVDAIGPVDVLVNLAAYGSGGVPAQHEAIDAVHTAMSVNLVAPFVLSQLVFDGMVAAGGGAIVNVGSIAGEVGIGRIPQASYAASKGGLHALTRELAAQWSRFGIRVNTLVPGLFRSEMTEGIYANDRLVEFAASRTLLGRHGEAADLVGGLLYLASDASAYVTGQTLTIDGGWTAQ